MSTITKTDLFPIPSTLSLNSTPSIPDRFTELTTVHPRDITENDVSNVTIVVTRSLELERLTAMSYVRALPSKQLFDHIGTVNMHGLAGGAIGVSIGCIGAACTGPAFPVVLPFSASICGGVGYGIGAAYSANKLKKQLTLEFEEWRSNQTSENLTRFKTMFAEHPALSITQCRMNMEPMRIPAHCNCERVQHVFEYDAILEFVKRNKKCPASNVEMNEEDIRVDYRTLGLINLTYKNFLNTASRVGNFNEEMMNGTRSLVVVLDKSKKFFFDREKLDLDQKMARALDPTPYTERLNEIAKLLNPKANK